MTGAQAAGQQNKQKKQLHGQLLPDSVPPSCSPGRGPTQLPPRTRSHPAALLPSPWPLPKATGPPTQDFRTSEGCPRISAPASKSHGSQRPKRVWGRGQWGHFPWLYHQEVKDQEGPSGVKKPSGLHLEDTREAAEARAPQERGVWEGSSPRTPWGGGQAWGHLATSGALICLETALPELRTPSPGSRSVCHSVCPPPPPPPPPPATRQLLMETPTCRNIPEFRSGLGLGAWVGKSPELKIHPPCDPGSQHSLAQLSGAGGGRPDLTPPG